MYSEEDITQIISAITFNVDGLVPVISQQYDSKSVLMMAWMNRDAVEETLRTGTLCYWSRSRQKLWRKGEESGHIQMLKEFIVDCDGDTILALVDQTGVACHTGRANCFFNSVKDGKLCELHPVITPPEDIYK